MKRATDACVLASTNASPAQEGPPEGCSTAPSTPLAAVLLEYPWSTWSAVINLTSRTGELRSAPSWPDARHRVTGKRALAPGVRGRRAITRLRGLAPRTGLPLNCRTHLFLDRGGVRGRRAITRVSEGVTAALRVSLSGGIFPSRASLGPPSSRPHPLYSELKNTLRGGSVCQVSA